MAKLTWVLYNSDASIDFTSSVKYFTYTQGRRSVLDNYGGGTATITMKNDAGQVAGAFLAYRQKILIKCEGTNAFIGWVQGIDYNDTPTGAASTATITLGDAWVLAGQQIATSQVLTSNTFQVTEIAALQFYTAQFSQDYASSSIRGSLGYAGDWATRLNEIVASDRGRFLNILGKYVYAPFNSIQNYYALYNFARTPTASAIGYQSLERVKAIGNQTYVNSAQVTPEALATQTATNIQALVVGQSTITVATLNTTVTDGMNTATWIANSMADATQQSFAITCSDIAQVGLGNIEAMLTIESFAQISYTPPGGVSTSEWVSVEGLTVRGFIDHTEIEFNLASFTYYRAFILDDTVMGVLDSSRLGW
jgi:hypothetical protein